MSSGVWDHLTLVTPPPAGDAGLICSVDEAKIQCRIDPGTQALEDGWFADTIAAAQAFIDGPAGAGISLLTQQWRLSLDRWPDQRTGIILPLGPIQSIDSVTYLPFGVTSPYSTLDATQYIYDLDAKPVRIVRPINVVWPIPAIVPGAIKVDFTTGFGETAADVPLDLKHVVKLLVSHWYQNRDAVVGVDGRDSSTITPLGVDAILDRYRVGRIA